MDETIAVMCAKCGKTLRCPASMAGRKGKCSGCGEPVEIPVEEAPCPAPPAAPSVDKDAPAQGVPAKKKPLTPIEAVQALAGLMVLGALIWWGRSCACSEPEPEGPRPFDKAQARYWAKEFVSQELLTPATAKFPWSDSDWGVIDMGGGKWMVTSHVDAQNAFGATLRKRFAVLLQVRGEKVAALKVELK